MRKFEIVTKFKYKNIILPKRATTNSAGYDLASATDVAIKPGEIQLIPTGLKVRMNTNEALFIFARSSLSIKKGLIMSNSVGVVDADYYGNADNEGHIMVPLMNVRNEEVTIEKGERVSQGVFIAYQRADDDKASRIRRLGGFGSSGKWF